MIWFLALVDFGFGRFGLVFGSGLVLVGSIRFGLVWYLVLVQLSWLSFLVSSDLSRIGIGHV